MIRVMCCIVTAGVLSSCCPKLYPVSSDKRDSISVRTEYIEKVRIDTVRIEMPREVVEVYGRDSVYRETSIAEAWAKSDDRGLFLHLRNKNVSLPKEVPVIDTFERYDSVRVQIVNEVKMIEVNRLKWWQKWLCWIGGISLVFIGVRIAFWIGKKQIGL